MTPRKKLRPKLSSYFTQHATTTCNKHEPLLVDIHSYGNRRRAGSYIPPAQPLAPSTTFCQPEAEELMENIMQTLMLEPLYGLDRQHTSSIMIIFEAYRNLRDENRRLLEKVDTETDRRYIIEAETERAHEEWRGERQVYKDEVKRLEILVARGRSGLAGVIEARKNSVLQKHRDRHGSDRDQKETVFEFLERTREEDQAAELTQRAVPRYRHTSSSRHMKELSHSVSMTSFYDDLLFQPRTTPSLPHGLQEQSSFDTESVRSEEISDHSQPSNGRKASFAQSDDTYLTFSSAGDPLPDEMIDDATLTVPVSTLVGHYPEEIRQAASLLADYKGISPASLVPDIMKLCSSMEGSKVLQYPKNANKSVPFGGRLSRDGPDLTNAMPDYQQKLPRSPTPSSSAPNGQRRYSFDLGDEARFGSLHNTSAYASDSPLSESDYSFQESNKATPHVSSARPALSILFAPTSPSPAAVAVASQIPSPTWSGYMARQRREASSSSSRTAVQDRQSSAASICTQSSLHSSRSKRESLSASTTAEDSGRCVSHRSVSPDGTLRVAQRLVEEMQGLRTNSLAVAAARVASMGVDKPRNDVECADSSTDHNARSGSGSRPRVS